MTDPLITQMRERQRRLDREAVEVVQPDNVGPFGVSPFRAGRVQSVADDYLVVRPVGADGSVGDSDSNDIKVAKREELRKAPFSPTNTTGDGKTYTYSSGIARVVAMGAITEPQVIVPAYRLPSGGFKGSLVFFSSVRYTGVIVDGVKLRYQDFTCDGRAWAKG